jgi:hypothetical protein
MKSLQDATRQMLIEPTPEALIALQGALLAFGQQDEAAARALGVAGRFYEYLSELHSKIAARDYSELASRLDIGAVGAVAMENILAAEQDSFWQRLVMGGLAEGLMVAASRQYVKGWQVETGLTHTRAVWYLAEALWRASEEMQPDLPAEQRWQAIQSLLAPAYDAEVPAPDKAVLLGRVFQMLLITHLSRLLPGAQQPRG